MSLQKTLATFFGDIWISKKCFGIGPIIYGYPDSMVNGKDYRKFCSVVQPGDLLLTRSENYKFSNKGIPERYTFLKHLAVYAGGVNGISDGNFIVSANPGNLYSRCIIHAISEGIVCQDVFDIFRHFDYIVAVRPWKSSFEQDMIVQSAFKVLGREYDFSFQSKNKSYYCTELGAHCLQVAGIAPPLTYRINAHILGLLLPLDRFKHDVYIADSFVENYKIVFKSESYKRRFPHD